MALTLIKEDGTGRADANSYASVADGDAYFDAHLYATAWTAATSDRKAQALVMATRLIDSEFQFNGFQAHGEQALQWPRERCPDPDSGPLSVLVLGLVGDNFVEPDLVPVPVLQATCEMARELLIADRTAAPAGEGITSIHTGHTDAAGAGATGASNNSTTVYNKGDTPAVISRVAQAMLLKYGAPMGGGSGAVRLVRA
jgi:hypothetical protein